MRKVKIASCLSVALFGIGGSLVEVEAALNDGLPGVTLIGLPDASLNEARSRVLSSFQSSGIPIGFGHTTINLAPASLPKQGSSFDLAIAVAIASASATPEIKQKIKDVVFLGELGLDGRIHPTKGILPAVISARKLKVKKIVVPKANLEEARLIEDVEIVAFEHLVEALNFFGANFETPEFVNSIPKTSSQVKLNQVLDFKDVLGQSEAKNALIIAAAGGHNIFLVGPPGTGKSMLASRFPSILPELSFEDSLEVSSIYSITGNFGNSLIKEPPFVAPHHTATAPAIIGGGSGNILPGAVSKANRGVLFLDEAPEFSPRVLQTLRQPLESGEVLIERAKQAIKFPAHFQLILAANPCPCGMYSSKQDKCRCSVVERRRYFSRLSGPLLDRIDLQVSVENIKKEQFVNDSLEEDSKTIRKRVVQARANAAERLKSTPWKLNSEVPGSYLRKLISSDKLILETLSQAIDQGRISLRKADRLLRVSFTIADLENKVKPDIKDLGLAMQLKSGYLDETK